ncbi:glycosyltransferase [Cetobacterium sp. 2G large]|uniref:glycosyltransferase n=1 Tax=Cetobacterium sp. 2G large TaxID=2759680 RepID=UPI00163C2103|nr:glycosyltransferase [Cetobacterium sp. 2G large]MBC2852545.1 glycosyltransferase [Cetobacterium sp. 2G large]
MKKILFCINSLTVGGAEKVLVQVVKMLSKNKEFEIEVLTMKETKNFLVDEIEKVANYDFILSNEELKKGFKIVNSLKKKYRIEKKIKEFDIVIDFLDGDFYRYLKNINKKKIVWLHSSYSSLLKRKRDIAKKIRGYDKIITICEEMKEELLEIEKDLDKSKVVNIYNPFDFNEILEKSNVEFLPEELEDSKRRYFVTVCRLKEDEKDVETLLKAYSKYKGKEYLYIIGDGPDKEKLEKLSEELCLTEKVKFLGMKKNPYNWVKNSEAFILSSKLEGFGLVLIEALTLNKKVISSSCKTGPKEILNNGEFGMLFEVGNEKELLKKIENVDKLDLNLEKLSKHLEKFEEEKIKLKVESLLKNE